MAAQGDQSLFSVVYRHDGREHSLEVWALDLFDAEHKVRAIASSMVVAGQIVRRSLDSAEAPLRLFYGGGVPR